MFTERPKDQGIFFVWRHGLNTSSRTSISASSTVTLRIGDERILVRDIASISLNLYKGVVFGFEPSFGVEYKELKLGQLVQFNESNIFGCNG